MKIAIFTTLHSFFNNNTFLYLMTILRVNSDLYFKFLGITNFFICVCLDLLVNNQKKLFSRFCDTLIFIFNRQFLQ